MEEDIKILGEYKKIELTSLLRTFKREGIENFIVVRRENLENLIKGYRGLEIENQSYRDYLGEPPCYDNAKYIPKSKIADKIKELVIEEETGYFDNSRIIRVLQELMEDK